MKTAALFASVVLFILQVLAADQDRRNFNETRGEVGHWSKDFIAVLASALAITIVSQTYIPTWVSYFRGDCWGMAPWQQWAKYAFVGYYVIRLFLHGRFTRRHDRMAERVARAAKSGKRNEFRMLLIMLIEMIVNTYQNRYVYALYVVVAVLATFYTCL
jgi:hypothetical protein